MCGRGGAANKHNGHFRQLVDLNKREYLQAKKNEKRDIARRIVTEIRQQGGRFLKKINENSADGGYWLELDDKKALEKTLQALREGLDVRKTSTGSDAEEGREDQSKRKASENDEQDYDRMQESTTAPPVSSPKRMKRGPTAGEESGYSYDYNPDQYSYQPPPPQYQYPPPPYVFPHGPYYPPYTYPPYGQYLHPPYPYPPYPHSYSTEGDFDEPPMSHSMPSSPSKVRYASASSTPTKPNLDSTTAENEAAAGDEESDVKAKDGSEVFPPVSKQLPAARVKSESWTEQQAYKGSPTKSSVEQV